MTDFLLRHGWPLLASVAVKSLFVLALAGLVVLALRRASAAARHLVWSLALLGLLLLPLFSSALPAFWQVPLGSRNLLVTPDAPTLTPSSPIPNSTGDGRPPAPNSGGAGGKAGSVDGRPGGSPLHLTPPELGAGGRSLPWQVWVCGGWLVGAVLTLLPSLIGLAGVRRLTRRSSSVLVGPLPDLTTELAQQLGVRAPVRLLLGEAGTPMTWGWLRPVILLPRGADQWPPDRLRAVLLHELAHIARADWPAQMASHLACAFYWFNPLVWLAAGQARLEGERACDDRVLLAGIPAPDYARHLLDVARSLRDTPLPTVLPMANSSRVEDRLRAILQPKRRHTMVTRKMFGVAAATALAVIAPLAVLRPVAGAQAPLPVPAMARPGMGDTDPASRPHMDAIVEFRSHLRAWALSHRALLRQLQSASTSDRRALQAVYAQLPPLPLYQGDPRVSPAGNSMPLLAIETPGFSPRHLVHSDDPIARWVQQNYTRYHDLKLASTLGVGPDNYSIWASGRVTKTHVFSRSQGHGQPLLTERIETTLVAPFDFLDR